MFARPSIDSLEFARNGLELGGAVPLGQLSRLDDLLVSRNGNLSFTLYGQTGKDGDFLLLSLQGVLYLRCQRCLEELEQPVSQTSRLKLVQAKMLDTLEETDDTDCIEATRNLDVWTLIEDEVLLGLPFAPRHENEACHSSGSDLKRAASPFAGLANLKK